MKKVYLVRAAQFYKIGISGNVQKRIASIQTGCPIRCEYVGYFPHHDPESLEKELHRRFSHTKTNGEWFDLGDDNIGVLVKEYNLKHSINPFARITEESNRVSKSEALKEARSISADIEEIDAIFMELFDGYCLSDAGKVKIRKCIMKYGFDCTASSLRHLASKFDHTKSMDKLLTTAKSFNTYGRHISDHVWTAWFIIKKATCIEDANAFLVFIMKRHLDEIAVRIANNFISDPDYGDDIMEAIAEYEDYLDTIKVNG